jgi:hypothetical protein
MKTLILSIFLIISASSAFAVSASDYDCKFKMIDMFGDVEIAVAFCDKKAKVNCGKDKDSKFCQYTSCIRKELYSRIHMYNGMSRKQKMEYVKTFPSAHLRPQVEDAIDECKGFNY